MLYEQILSEQNRLDSQISSIKKQLANLPPGKIISSKNGDYHSYFQSFGSTKSYIPKKNSDLIENLIYKKYLTLQLMNLEHERLAIDLFLKHYPKDDYLKSFLEEIPNAADILPKYFTPLSEELSLWQQEDYPRNENHPEHLIHQGMSGNMLRSKSESIIDMFLAKNQIPFHYEEQLILDDAIYYPDFTIRHPRNGKYYYWEHLGLMDDPKYVKRNLRKLEDYVQNGIIPSVNLILTFETSDHPLTISEVEHLIDWYFLSN